jgi:hypothetical protein
MYVLYCDLYCVGIWMTCSDYDSYNSHDQCTVYCVLLVCLFYLFYVCKDIYVEGRKIDIILVNSKLVLIKKS